MKNINVVFMGTPSFAVPILEALINEYNVILVVCQPDREKDKKGNIIFPKTKELALKHNIPVFQPVKIKSEYQYILNCKPDIIITCAYGQIVPVSLLEYPKYGCINVHGSLLPNLRGGAPIHHALIDGYDKTGVTIMEMSEKMDAGDIISKKEIIITDDEYLSSLYYKLSLLGRDLLMETLPNIINGNITKTKQNEDEVTFGYNIKKEDEKIDFNKNSRQIFNLVRGLNEIPAAYTLLNNKRIKIFKVVIGTKIYDGYLNGTIIDVTNEGIVVKTNDGSIIIKELQFEGKNKAMVKDIINGIKKEEYIGKILG